MSRNIGIMRRLKHYLPLSVLRTIYNTLVLPYFQYSILTWGFRLGRVTLLQKRAMRVITCSLFYAHTDPLFKKLNLLKVQDFLEVNVLKKYYKYKKGELPLYMTEMFSTFSRAHNYNTRLSMTLDEPISLTRCGQLCIRYYLPKVVNKTNAALLSKVDTMSFESFTRCVKRSIISQYKEHCNNRGCFWSRWEAQAAGHPVNPPAWWLAESLSSRTAGVPHRDATGTTWTTEDRPYVVLCLNRSCFCYIAICHFCYHHLYFIFFIFFFLKSWFSISLFYFSLTIKWLLETCPFLRWLLRKRDIHTLVRVSWHNYVCVLSICHVLLSYNCIVFNYVK